jgi:hypothetical protein
MEKIREEKRREMAWWRCRAQWRRENERKRKEKRRERGKRKGEKEEREKREKRREKRREEKRKEKRKERERETWAVALWRVTVAGGVGWRCLARWCCERCRVVAVAGDGRWREVGGVGGGLGGEEK